MRERRLDDSDQPRAAKTAAVVLAAGRSSRMGTAKPLLAVGGVSALARVVYSVRAAGVGQVVVVSGHDPEPLLPILQRLGVDRAHNPGYDAGMFSSIRVGATALDEDTDAFFVMPVDCPLVNPRVHRLLLAEFARSHRGVTYPVCFARRGHPPLVSGDHIPALLEADQAGTLQAFLDGFAEDAVEVDVRDLTVLMDMDTPRDHAMLDSFAAILDSTAGRLSSAPGAGRAPTSERTPGTKRAPSSEPALTPEQALFVLHVAGTPSNVVRHCRAVAAAGRRLAKQLKVRVPTLDVDLVLAGCLLHDLGRLHPNHAGMAEEVLTNLGLPRLGAVVGQHMVIAPELPGAPGITEEELVYLADKLVAEDELVGLDERETRAARKIRPGPDAEQGLKDRMHDARVIADKVAAILGRRIDQVLEEPGLDEPDEAPSANILVERQGRVRESEIYLVRHAQPAGPGGRRFLGQSDPALGIPGEKRARQLRDRLRGMTGGTCFEAIFSSDLQRCLRTAEIVTEDCPTAVHSEPWLREIDAGLWEGLTWEEARMAYPAEYLERERDIVGYPFPGGESFRDLQARVIPPFLRLLSESVAAGHRVLVVGHKGVNRVILAHLLALPLEDIFSLEQDYCAVTLLRVSTDAEGGTRVAVTPS